LNQVLVSTFRWYQKSSPRLFTGPDNAMTGPYTISSGLVCVFDRAPAIRSLELGVGTVAQWCGAIVDRNSNPGSDSDASAAP
jgi:hypothetical protein